MLYTLCDHGRRAAAMMLAMVFAITTGCMPEEVLELGITPRSIIILNGLEMNGLGSNGIAFNSIILNGIVMNGIALNGIALNSIVLNSINLNGIVLNSIVLNSIVLNELKLHEVKFNGMRLNGVVLSDIELSRATLNGALLTAQELAELKVALRYMVECALESGQCITIEDVDGALIQYCGDEGLDPGWADQSPDMSVSDVMAVCVSERAVLAGDMVEYEPVNLNAFKTVLRYMVECALPEGDSVLVVEEDGVPVPYYGALGLAPQWRDSALDLTGQKMVTACLAARSNANQQPVHISLRLAGMPIDAVERDLYPWHEGGFWGNVFAGEPQLRACLVQGGGLSGRVCAESADCGFELMGDCAELCSERDPDSGAYTGCEQETAVINTFLNLGTQVSSGSEHLCYIQEDDSLWCLGINEDGQLGQGYLSALEPSPLQVSELGMPIAEIRVGINFSCARTTAGAVYCWGGNQHGPLGEGTTNGHSLPVQVSGMDRDVAIIGVSEQHACAIKTNGTLWCWGWNQSGQVGDGSVVDQLVPVQVSVLGADMARVSTGSWSDTTCAVSNSGTLWCWGKNDWGQVGDGTLVNRVLPVQIATDAGGAPFAGLTDVCSGEAHTCARKSDGTVWCWGSNQTGQLGKGGPASNQPYAAPEEVVWKGTAAPGGLSCGARHTCVVATDSSVWCWGDNSAGAIGDGTMINRTVPTRVNSLKKRAAFVTAGMDHSCATKIDGSTWCWGQDTWNTLIPGGASLVPILSAL